MQSIIDQLNAAIKTSTEALVTAKQAATAIPEIEADLSRFQSALKALGAPQTPKGRKAIGDAARARKGKVTTVISLDAKPDPLQNQTGPDFDF